MADDVDPYAALPSRARIESFGHELVLENVLFEDAGTYTCASINDVTAIPVRRTFQLTVEG